MYTLEHYDELTDEQNLQSGLVIGSIMCIMYKTTIIVKEDRETQLFYDSHKCPTSLSMERKKGQ